MASGIGLQVASAGFGYADPRGGPLLGWGLGLMLAGMLPCMFMYWLCRARCDQEEQLRNLEASQERQRLMDEAQALRDKRAMERGYEEGLRKGKEDAIAVLTARRLT